MFLQYFFYLRIVFWSTEFKRGKNIAVKMREMGVFVLRTGSKQSLTSS
jgi:hypothetical protein